MLKRRRTPSLPMAAIHPEAYTDPNDVEITEAPGVKLDDVTRDELILKTIARVERIDSEVEILVETLERNRSVLAAVITDQHHVVDEVKILRDEYFSDVPVAILSNSTTVHLPHIRDALMRLDKRIMKLDGGDEETFRAVNRPHPSVTLAGVIDGLCLLTGISIQSAFMTGSVDNVCAEHVEAWIQALQRIQPEDIQMYTIDRPSADGLIEKVQRSVLENIAREVEDRTGISATVY